MTGEQKKTTLDMRRQGLTYRQIAAALGISVNTVKSFCRRNNLPTKNQLSACGVSNDNRNEKIICKNCGKKLEHTPKAKPKSFCGDACRHAWWNANRDKLHRKALYHLTCAHCGTSFESYGNNNRKYCGHPCYVKARFGEAANCDQRTV